MPGTRGQHNDWALLACPSWLTAAMAYVKDVNAVIASRQELAGTKAVVDPTTKKPPPKKKKEGGK